MFFLVNFNLIYSEKGWETYCSHKFTHVHPKKFQLNLLVCFIVLLSDDDSSNLPTDSVEVFTKTIEFNQ